jgi:NADPH-dependent 2,4-dienoyl-CoA reductase/sulfur reductase-like enzyme
VNTHICSLHAYADSPHALFRARHRNARRRRAMEGSPNVPYHSAGGGTSRILQDLYLSKVSHTEQQDSMLRTAMSRAKLPVSVGIVGAGFAGLRCADVLLQHGFKVTILEARNRLGGRVGQSWHLGHPVDLYVRIMSF